MQTLPRRRNNAQTEWRHPEKGERLDELFHKYTAVQPPGSRYTEGSVTLYDECAQR